MNPSSIQIERDIPAGTIRVKFAGSVADIRLANTAPQNALSVVIDGVEFDREEPENQWIEWCMWLVLGDEPTGFHYYSAEYLATNTEQSDIPEQARPFAIAVLAHALDASEFNAGLKINALRSLVTFFHRWPERRADVRETVEAFHEAYIAAPGDSHDEDLVAQSARVYVETAEGDDRVRAVGEIVAAAVALPSLVDGVYRAFELSETYPADSLLELSQGSGAAATRAARFLPKVHEAIDDAEGRRRLERTLIDAIGSSENPAVLDAAFQVAGAANSVAVTAAAFERILARLQERECDQAMTEALLAGWGRIGLDKLPDLPIEPDLQESDAPEPELLLALTGEFLTSPAGHLLYALDCVGQRLTGGKIQARAEAAARAIKTVILAAQRLDGSRFLLDARRDQWDDADAANWLCETLEQDHGRLESVCKALVGVSLGSFRCREMSRLLELILEGCVAEQAGLRQAALAALEQQLQVDAPLGNIYAEGLLRLTDPDLLRQSLADVEMIESGVSDAFRSWAMGRQQYGPGRRMREVLPWQQEMAEASKLLERCEEALIAGCSDSDEDVAATAVELVAHWQIGLLARELKDRPFLQLGDSGGPLEAVLVDEPDPSLDALLHQWSRFPNRVAPAVQTILDRFQLRLNESAVAALTRQDGFAGALLHGIEPDQPSDKRRVCVLGLIELTSAEAAGDALRLAVARAFAESRVFEGDHLLCAAAAEGLTSILGRLKAAGTGDPPDEVQRIDPWGVGPLIDALLRLFEDAGNAGDVWPNVLIALRHIWDRDAVPRSRMRPVLDAVRVALIDSDGPEVIKNAVPLVECIGSSEATPGVLRDHAATVLLEAAATADLGKLITVLKPIGSMQVSSSWRSRAVQELNVLREATTDDEIRDAVDSALRLHKGPIEELVFISYARQDQAFAIELSFALQQEGVYTWRDMDDIPKGADWDATINDAAADCKRMIVILTRKSVVSEWVRNEWTRALTKGNRIFPVLLEECEVPEPLTKLQYTHFIGQARPARETLLQLVRDLSRAR